MLVRRLYFRLSTFNVNRFARRLIQSNSTDPRLECKFVDEEADESRHENSIHDVKSDLDTVGEFIPEDDRNVMSQHPNITRGKKLKPGRANIVVLDAKQSGLLKQRELPNYFKRRNGDSRLSILEGVELGTDHELTRYTDSKSLLNEVNGTRSNSSDVLRAIESQRKKLLIFKSRVSKEQALRSIHYQKPSTSVLSRKRYDQIKQLLESAYTASQLKTYAKKYYNLSSGKITKSEIISRVINECWQCSVSDTMNETEDLVLERIIDVNTRDMYLLLLTNNGKILNNFARIGATVAVALDENIVIVRGTASIIRYVEVSLNKILGNVSTLRVSIKDIISHHTERNSVKPFDMEELISLVQRESAVYFERVSFDNEDTGDAYELSAFGSKRVLNARNLLLWGVKYQPQLVEKISFHCLSEPSSFKKFPFTNTECLDWIDKTKEWCRLQMPLAKISSQSTKSVGSEVKMNSSDEKLDEWYDFLMNENNNAKMVDLKLDREPSKIFSMTLGQILRPLEENDSNKGRIFEPKITQVTSKLLELPLYDSLCTKDELFTVDQHEYYVQLKFIPDLSTFNDQTTNAPPIEIWFELDDYDNAITSTARCMVQMEQKSLLLQTPQLQHDYKISTDLVGELIQTFEENQEDWLADQPGIKEFLQESHLTFNSKKKLVIPRSINVDLPTKSSVNKSTFIPIRYDYINANYHRVLRLFYMDKYMVQFSDVNGGPLGGRYTQVDFIGGESLSRTDFKRFVKDISKCF